MHERPRAAARDPFVSDHAEHNSTVIADRQADACACPACAETNRGPRAIADVRRRGPIQCESGRLDPLDAAAMRQVEGRP